jgi:hypothetical protein
VAQNVANGIDRRPSMSALESEADMTHHNNSRLSSRNSPRLTFVDRQTLGSALTRKTRSQASPKKCGYDLNNKTCRILNRTHATLRLGLVLRVLSKGDAKFDSQINVSRACKLL